MASNCPRESESPLTASCPSGLEKATISWSSPGQEFSLRTLKNRSYPRTRYVIIRTRQLSEVYFRPQFGETVSLSLSFPSDIWTLTCMMWEILGQRTLFEGFPSPSDDWMIKEHVKTLAIKQVPEGWRAIWMRPVLSEGLPVKDAGWTGIQIEHWMFDSKSRFRSRDVRGGWSLWVLTGSRRFLSWLGAC
ncbi:uncharacterized protein BDV17DRAFT_267671 [Aspergillus undulatus]|uniref:uncharacterized protein n=1 Tax=Aspergillus undulatus TaxID=1810928 RepID=UPI003CCDA77D